MCEFESKKNELVVCGKPPVNGNICEKFVAVDDKLNKVSMVWSNSLESFVFEGTDAKLTYSQLERWYEKFIWIKSGK